MSRIPKFFSRPSYQDDADYRAALAWYDELVDKGEHDSAKVDLLYEYVSGQLQQTVFVYDQLAGKLEGLLKFSLLLFGALLTAVNTFPSVENAIVAAHAVPWFYLAMTGIGLACLFQAIGLLTQSTAAPMSPLELVKYASEIESPKIVKFRLAGAMACSIEGFRPSIRLRANMHDWSIGLLVIAVISCVLLIVGVPAHLS